MKITYEKLTRHIHCFLIKVWIYLKLESYNSILKGDLLS